MRESRAVSYLEALILALVQGLTEFLPVSSSGHLALAGALLRALRSDAAHEPAEAAQEAASGAHEEGLFYGVLLHVATMLAVSVYFRRELWSLTAAFRRSDEAPLARRVLLLLFVASVPTAAIGFAIRDQAANAFEHSPPLVGLGLLVTSLLLVSTLALRERSAPQRPGKTPAPGAADEGRALEEGGWLADLGALRLRDAVVVGLAQGLAVWPGVSRSGSTIAAALWMGVRPLAAARFSLLASLPAIGGGFLLEARQLEGAPERLGPELVGAGVAFVVGLLAIGWLMAVVRGRRLAWFAIYTAILGAVGCSAAWWG